MSYEEKSGYPHPPPPQYSAHPIPMQQQMYPPPPPQYQQPAPIITQQPGEIKCQFFFLLFYLITYTLITHNMEFSIFFNKTSSHCARSTRFSSSWFKSNNDCMPIM